MHPTLDSPSPISKKHIDAVDKGDTHGRAQVS
jgi:hypothetical protein